MERRKFIKSCCYTGVGLPILATTLHSCGSIYYASATREENRLVINKSDFWQDKIKKETIRDFVLVKTENMDFPICLHKINEDEYSAALMHCTHRGCELNVGGGIFSCPCHGSEFSIAGKVLQGPAEKNLRTFKTETDDEHIYIL